MPWTPALQRLQQEDSTLEKIRGILLNSDQEVRGNAMFVMKEGIIYQQWSANSYEGEEVVEQLAGAASNRRCRAEVLKLVHTVPMEGPLGVKNTTDRILQRFYCPKMFHDVKEFCHSWDVCQKVATRKNTGKARLISLPIIEETFSRIAMDIVRPLERSKSGSQ